jgi:N-acetylmuramoyl-L-alanine amidase
LNIIETYYFGAQADEDSLRLAEAENQGSEYLMAEFKGMIKKIGDNFKQQESNALASSIQDNLFRHMKAQNEKVVNRGTKMAPFVVLLGADMPSVLAEITCISNSEEAIKLADPAYLETFAQHLEGGIVAYLNKTHSNANATNTNSTNGAKQNGEERRASGRASGKG